MQWRASLCSIVFIVAEIATAVAARAEAPPAAGTININATTLALSRTKMSGAIRVSSTKMSADLLQVHVYAWAQRDGKDVMTPTDDLVGLPLAFTLPANGSQTVRVGMRGPVGGGEEMTYRVVVSEVAPDAIFHRGLSSILAFNFPVYVAPVGALERKIAWNVQAVDAHHVRLTAQNSGNVHVTIRRIALLDGGKTAAEVTDARSVLAGASHTWDVTTSGTAARSFEVEATTDDGVVRSRVL